MDCTLQGKDDKPVRVSSKWISLDACDQRYYALCLNLQSSEVTTITKLSEKGVRWYCSECSKDTDKDPQFSKTRIIHQQLANKLDNIERMVKTLTNNTDEKMRKFEKKWVDVKKHTENIDQSKQVTQQAKVILQKNNNKKKKNRKNNAIVTGITKRDGQTALEQIKELRKLECFTGRILPFQAMRLGSKKENMPEQRKPMKVRFEDETSKWEFLIRFANDTLKSRNIYCKLHIHIGKPTTIHSAQCILQVR